MTGRPVSVTTWIGTFFSTFDADTAIDNMMSSKYWSKSKYYGQTREQIKQGWEQNGTESSDLGTALHESIDYFMNGQLEPEQVPMVPEFLYFLEFYYDLTKLNPDWKPYRTEWFIFDRELRIDGSIDMIMINSKGELWILDWKRSKKVTLQNNKKAKRPIAHLDDCKFNTHSLQVNLYGRILERNYDKKIVRMDLVVCHPINTNYLTFEVKKMDTEINSIIAYRKRDLMQK